MIYEVRILKFIEFKEIPRDSVTIDVRTKTEYANNGILQDNIPIMSERDHRVMKRFIIFALPIIMYKIYQNRRGIETEVEKILKANPERELVFGCSRGRLRSPLTAMYVAYKFRVKVCVIRGGVKFICPLSVSKVER